MQQVTEVATSRRSSARSARIRPERVTDRVLEWDEAPAALLEPHTKLVFSRA